MKSQQKVVMDTHLRACYARIVFMNGKCMSNYNIASMNCDKVFIHTVYSQTHCRTYYSLSFITWLAMF